MSDSIQTNGLRYAALVSGSGTLLRAALDEGLLPSVVIADRECAGLDHAREYGIPAVIIDRLQHGFAPGADWDRDGFTKEITYVLWDHEIDFVMMWGFMTLLGPRIFEAGHFGGRIFNAHPGDPTKYKGDNAVADAIAAGETRLMCVVFPAVHAVDAGQPILAGFADVTPDRDVAASHEALKKVEWIINPAAVRWAYANLTKRSRV